MHAALVPPTGVTIVAAAVAAILAALLPTCLYLYVEPRGRLSWGTGADLPATRRAPAVVRWTAWLSFAVGQLAIPWLLVPVACAVLLYLQMKLGVGRVMGPAATLATAAVALLQAALASRLLPLGVRLLARDRRLSTRALAIARTNGCASALVLGVAATLSWAMAAVPGLVHPWLRAALTWTALRPVMGYAALSLLHALLLGRCASFLADPAKPKR
ncbi:MAG TPA: hypothetical protein VE987_13375 [Polyangiaceae bacterium]|nr:hypothetical protein [Polyangiaceae bacterium]